jgi:hypothetical protein
MYEKPVCGSGQTRDQPLIDFYSITVKRSPMVGPLCSICKKLVDLKTCKTDEDGYAIHEECYVPKLIEASRANSPTPKEETL